MAGRVVWFTCRTGKVRVERPRLRRRGAGEGGEVEVPAYAAMRRPGAVADRMLEVLMAGVSTRKYGRVIGEMADTVGVSKSAVSRETVEASERVLKELMERRLDAWDLLVIYLDGIQMGSHHVLAAVGVDSDGKKHVLGVREGASENAEVTSALLEDLVERGLDPGRRRLFVIDGSKALRKAIEKVFGQRHPIQRCRNHKLRNVLGHLPKDQHAQVKAVFRAAMKLDAKEGEQKLEQLARWLERDHPSAAASLREGLSEMFTINRLGLPPRLRKCLGSTNLIDSTHSGVRQKTRRVTNWKNGAMALRWAAGLVRGDREELPPHHRLRPALDAQSPPRRPRTSCPNEEGRLTKSYSGATTFNCQRDTIRGSVVVCHGMLLFRPRGRYPRPRTAPTFQPYAKHIPFRCYGLDGRRLGCEWPDTSLRAVDPGRAPHASGGHEGAAGSDLASRWLGSGLLHARRSLDPGHRNGSRSSHHPGPAWIRETRG